MSDFYRDSRYREYDDPPEDDRYSRTTVRRYKVKPGREDQHEVVEVDEDYRPAQPDSHRRRHHHHEEYDNYEPDRRQARPRSTIDPYDDRALATGFNGDDDPRRPRYGRQPDDLRVERRVTDHWEDSHGHDVDRYRKETEYYARPRGSDVGRFPPEDVPRGDPGVMVLRNRDQGRDRELARRDRRLDDDYYRQDPRYMDPEREREMAMARYDRYRRDQGYSSDEDDRQGRRRVARRERSESPPHHHKRELAAGALAGAGITALLNSRRDEDGDLPDHRGRKIAAGGALGVIGTEALRRAHSAYGDRFHSGRESPDHHSTLKKGLGVAAVALAAAGAAKYYQSSKIEKEEAHRGRSRRRDSGGYDDYSDRSASRGKSRGKSRGRSLSTAGKAALGAAATAGLVQHYRSKSRGGSRSKSRLRRAAEIGGAAAAAGVAGKLWSNHKEKKERRSRSRAPSYSDSDDDRDLRGGVGRSHSRPRSQAGSLRHTDLGSDPELGLVEYGHGPLSPSQRSSRGYEYEAEERRRRRRQRRGSSASDDASGGARHRSKSRLRDMATAGAAAIGIKEFQDRKDREKRDRRSQDDRAPPSRERSRRRPADDSDGYFDDRPGRSGSPPVASGGGAYYPPYPATPGATATSGGYAPFPHPEQQTYVPQDYTGYPPPPAGGPPGMAGFAPPGPPAAGPPPGPPRAAGRATPDNVSDARRGEGWNAEAGVRRRWRYPSDEDLDASNQAVDGDMTAAPRRRHRRTAERGSSDPSSNRASVLNRTKGREIEDGRVSNDDDDDVELLPDRFDSEGRPLDGRSASHGPRGPWTTRQGQFERRPRRPGDWDVRGSWQVGGTDAESVERMVRSVTDVLDGRRGWMGLISDVLGGGGLLGDSRHDDDDEMDSGRGNRRQRRR